MREIGARDFPALFDFSDWEPQVSDPVFYARLLSHLGRLRVWETEYYQRLEPADSGHPVRHFTQSTALRPFAEVLGPRLDDFVAAYDAALAAAYPAEADGSVIFPFRRLFFTLTKD